MATTSQRSFNQYSGLDRFKQMQPLQKDGSGGIPSALDRLQDPGQFGAGQPGDMAMRSTAPWAMGLAERGATAVGRSTRDPYRAFEMLSRGTARQGQLQAALGLRQLQQQDADPIDLARQQQFGDGGGFSQRQPLSGYRRDQYGNILSGGSNLFGGTGRSPSVSASRSGIGSAMSNPRRFY